MTGLSTSSTRQAHVPPREEGEVQEEALTPKREAFAQAYIETGNASEAYRRSFNAQNMKPETINREAKALLDHPKVSTRIAELRAKTVERHEIAVDDLIAELDEARTIALSCETPQTSAAVSATTAKAKLLGLMVEKSSGTVNHVHTVELMTEQEKRNLLADAFREALAKLPKKVPTVTEA